MKLLFPILMICIFFAPANGQLESYIKQTIVLKNNIGQLEIMLPTSFDTSYSWTKYSDDACSDYEMFRFANKKYDLHKEAGFMDAYFLDSSYSFTVQQPKLSECGNKNLTTKEYFIMLVEREKADNPHLVSDLKIKTIKGQDYIVTYRTPFEPNPTRYGNMNYVSLTAKTIISGQIIDISFTCLAKNCAGFIDKFENSLTTIKIK